MKSTPVDHRLANDAECLEHLVAPLTPQQFVDRYWQRRPLYLPGSPTKFAALFDRKSFLRAAPAAEIEAFLADVPTTTIGAGAIPGVLGKGGMVCATGIERGDERLARYATGLRAALQETGFVDFRAYLSPPGEGLRLHYDERTATTLQIGGRKRWWFSKEAGVDYPQNPYRSPRREDWERVQVPDVKDLVEVVLKPGDVLCLPAGTWHQAQAIEESLSLNLAFEHRLDYFDLLASALRLKLGDRAYWRRPPPAALGPGSGGVPPAVSEYYRSRARRLESVLATLGPQSLELERVWRRAVAGIPLSARGDRPRHHQADQAASPPAPRLRREELLSRQGPLVYAPRRASARTTRVFLYHRTSELALPVEALPILDRLQSAERFRAGDVVGWSGSAAYRWPDVRVLLQFLLDAGVLARVPQAVRAPRLQDDPAIVEAGAP